MPWRSSMDNRVRDPREIMRDEMIMRDKVLDALRDGPRTVPEIAEAIGYPVHEVMYWVMAARKYGYVEESKEPNEDDYYQYALKVEE
jgi:predicted Rossmann fold nucleotide-binding protein DprA/Smf involved in DNA uptake